VALLIDPPAWPAHGRLWSHLISDTSLAELHEFAAANGVPRRGFERDHYDVPADMHDALVAAGAVPVSAREVVHSLRSSGLRRRKATAMSRKPPGRELIRPPRLRPDDLVAVTATAGVVWEDRLAPGLARLQSWELRTTVGAHALDGHDTLPYLAGNPEDRAADFTAAWQNPDVGAIVVARGGYGTQLMVDLLDWRRLAEGQPKAVVGFSDVSALHQALASRLGIVSVHSHVATSLGVAEEDSAERLRRLLMDPDDVEDLLEGQSPSVLVGGTAEGVLVGGNLMVLSADVGTSTMRPARGGIVILEEVGEEPYRIDRTLNHLVRSGWFDGARGIVCGAFTDCGEPALIEQILRERLRPLGVPTVIGVDLGHTPTTISVPLGVRAMLDADADTLLLAEPPLA
jgi:muramoyltetrapeptide carboxypeptidase